MNRTLLKRMIITSAIAVLGVSTSFAALVMERDQSVDTAPSVNMYRFEVPAELQEYVLIIFYSYMLQFD